MIFNLNVGMPVELPTRDKGVSSMKTALITLALTLLLSATLEAATGFLVDQYTKGNKRYCVYDVLSERVIITIDAYKICPLSIEE